MKHVRTFIAALALFFAAAPALAQWQVPDHSVPIGRGGGIQGFKNAAPGTAGLPFASNGAAVDPTFQLLGYAGGGTNANTQVLARNNIFPAPTRAGDVAYWNGTAWVTLAGNNAGTNCFGENATGVPSWLACLTSTAFTTAIVATTAANPCFAVGPNGSTNPVLSADCSVASSVAGLRITGAVTAGRVAVDVTDSGANSSLGINAKGTGNIVIGNVSTGGVSINDDTAVVNTSGIAFAVGQNGSNNPVFLVDTSAASAVAGLRVVGAATGGTVNLLTLDSGTNNALAINAKGNGAVSIANVSTGGVVLGGGGGSTTVANITGSTQCVQANSSGVLSGSGVACPPAPAASSVALGANVAISNASYTAGPTAVHGNSGTFFASGKLTIADTAGNASVQCKLWDGTTVADSANVSTVSTGVSVNVALTGIFTNPTTNSIKISCQSSLTTSLMFFAASGNSRDSSVTVFRIQ